MITHAEIMRVALNDYLGSEKQWCKGSWARDAEGEAVDHISSEATQHCAEGAIRAATSRLGIDVGVIGLNVMHGVGRTLAAQHPEIAEALRAEARRLGFTTEDFVHHIPAYNDGINGHADVGYEGIRAAFEKYLAECEEKGL